MAECIPILWLIWVQSLGQLGARDKENHIQVLYHWHSLPNAGPGSCPVGAGVMGQRL